MKGNEQDLEKDIAKINEIIMAQACHHSECANCPMHGKCHLGNEEVYDGDFVQEEFWERL